MIKIHPYDNDLMIITQATEKRTDYCHVAWNFDSKYVAYV